jgi:hypothetical protein
MRAGGAGAVWVGALMAATLLGCGSPGDGEGTGLAGIDVGGFNPDAAVGVLDGGADAGDAKSDAALGDQGVVDADATEVESPDVPVPDGTADAVDPDVTVDVVGPDAAPDAAPDVVIPDAVPDVVIPDAVPDVVIPDAVPDVVIPDAVPDATPEIVKPPDVCAPACGGKQCGSDGCGGVCGSCAATETCGVTGQCEPPTTGCNAVGGSETWKTSLGGSASDVLFDLVPVAGGGWAAAGYRTSTIDSNGVQGWLVRLAANGDLVDDDLYGGTDEDRLRGITRSGDTWYMVGESASGDAKDSDGWLVVAEANGKLSWDKLFGGSGYDVFEDVAVVNGGLVIVGSKTVSPKGNQLWVMRTDMDGNIEWEKTFGDAWSDHGEAILPVADGLIVAGTYDKVNFANTQAWLLKLGFDGALKWDEVYENCRSAEDVVAFQGGYVTVGEAYSSVTGKGFSMCGVRTNASGVAMWDKAVFDDAGSDGGYGVAVAGSNLVFVGRHALSGSSAKDGLLVVKANAAGESQWHASFGGMGAGHAAQVLGSGHLVVAGVMPGNGDESDGVVMKLTATGALCETCGDGTCQPATEDCELCPQDCGACPEVGSCCEPQTTPGCVDETIETCVCKQDDWCCNEEWDDLCVQQVQSFGCGTCTP